jgi:hypothetical protein
MSMPVIVDDGETVARILHREWIVDGELQIYAFALRKNETYISVNRPSVASFESDVLDFIIEHPVYRSESDSLSFKQAELNVCEIRNITSDLGELSIDVSVEVEPRDSHYKSHAGIFTRVEGRNIKGGQQQMLITDNGKVVSYEAIQLKVQYALLALSNLKNCQLSRQADSQQ